MQQHFSATKQQRLRQHLMAAALVALVFFLTYGLYGIQYRTNDDATLANLAAGAYGDSLHLVYVNVLFSLALRPLYALAPSMNWYVLVQIGLVYLAAVMLTDLALEKLGTLKGSLLSLTVMLPFAYVLLYRFQYVHNSGILLAAGLILIATDLGRCQGRTIAGILLAFVGSLLRWPNFLAIGGLSAALLLGRFFQLDRDGQKKAVATMLAFFVLVFGAKGLDSWYYQQDPDWQYFTDYNDARTAFSDYAIYHLDGDPMAYTAEGFSLTETNMLARWDFYDPAVYTPEKIQAAAAAIPRRPLTTAIKSTIKTGISLFQGILPHYLFAGLLLFALLALRWNRRALPFLGTLGLFGGMLFYLNYLNRFPSYVELPLLLALILDLIFCLSLADLRFPLHPGILVGALAIILVLIVPHIADRRVYSQEHRQAAAAEEVYFAQMEQDKDHLYLLATDAVSVCAGQDVLHPRPKDFYSNVVHYGGWLSGAPFCTQAMAAYGVTRPLVDAVDNDAVYLGYHGIDYVVAYVSEQLGCPVEAVDCGPNAFAPYQLRRVTNTPAA